MIKKTVLGISLLAMTVVGANPSMAAGAQAGFFQTGGVISGRIQLDDSVLGTGNPRMFASVLMVARGGSGIGQGVGPNATSTHAVMIVDNLPAGPTGPVQNREICGSIINPASYNIADPVAGWSFDVACGDNFGFDFLRVVVKQDVFLKPLIAGGPDNGGIGSIASPIDNILESYYVANTAQVSGHVQIYGTTSATGVTKLISIDTPHSGYMDTAATGISFYIAQH